MKKRMLVFLVAALVISTLPLYASGNGDTVVSTAGPGGPQYGGTITTARIYGDPTGADMFETPWPAQNYVHPVLDHLLTGNIDKYGPRGTNEFAFTSTYATPAKFTQGGGITESWELSPDGTTITYHLRQGVYWAAMGKEHVMETRELTADDIVFNYNRIYSEFTWAPDRAPVEDMYAADKYTFVVEMPTFNVNWEQYISNMWSTQLYAPEVIEAGASDWDNLVGTGPFLVKEYIPGSAMYYERNPLFYDSTVIDGVEYELPFVDELVFVQMPDESTRIAALRTGTVDFMGGVMSPVALRYEDTLRQTSPDLIIEPYLATEAQWIGFPYSTEVPVEFVMDRDVRRALMVGLDLEAIAQATLGQAEVHSWPVSSLDPDTFTPFDELPESSQLLYGYDPELAQQMLADAGYPDGFTLVMPVDGSDVLRMDMTSMIKDQWSKIGVEVDMRVMESGALNDFLYEFPADESPPWHGFIERIVNVLGISAITSLGVHQAQIPVWYADRYEEAIRTVDADARNAIIKEILLQEIDDVLYMPIGTPYELLIKWPWVKNWYGEYVDTGRGMSHITARMWIDQGLKEELGY